MPHLKPMKTNALLITAVILAFAACSQPAEPATSGTTGTAVQAAPPTDTINNKFDRQEVKEIQKDTTKVAR